jgi:hypothetical protein
VKGSDELGLESSDRVVYAQSGSCLATVGIGRASPLPLTVAPPFECRWLGSRDNGIIGNVVLEGMVGS